MGKTGKVLKGCLLAACAFVLSMLALLGIYIAWGMHANSRAEAAAAALCSGVRIGDRIETVVAKAEAGDPRPRVGNTSDGEFHFTYQGGMFNSRVCQLSTVQGRVTAKRTTSHDDD